jgi:hypothetical protein
VTKIKSIKVTINSSLSMTHTIGGSMQALAIAEPLRILPILERHIIALTRELREYADKPASAGRW